jgi:hypothetical protein
MDNMCCGALRLARAAGLPGRVTILLTSLMSIGSGPSDCTLPAAASD